MPTSLAKALFWWLTIMILIQPILTIIDQNLDAAVQSTTAWAVQKITADEAGYLTPEIRSEIYSELQKYLFAEDDIEIITNTVETIRGNRFDLTIRVNRGKMFLYTFTTKSQPNYYYHNKSAMIETPIW